MGDEFAVPLPDQGRALHFEPELPGLRIGAGQAALDAGLGHGVAVGLDAARVHEEGEMEDAGRGVQRPGRARVQFAENARP